MSDKQVGGLGLARPPRGQTSLRKDDKDDWVLQMVWGVLKAAALRAALL